MLLRICCPVSIIGGRRLLAVSDCTVPSTGRIHTVQMGTLLKPPFKVVVCGLRAFAVCLEARLDSSTIPIILDTVRDAAQPITGSSADYDALLEFIGSASVVLLGEASHGTHEFYRSRAQITERLICEKGFSAVAVEADWPMRIVSTALCKGQCRCRSSHVLSGFKRFPTWMWRNADVLEFLGWLRKHNDRLEPEKRAGFTDSISTACMLRWSASCITSIPSTRSCGEGAQSLCLFHTIWR